MVDECMSDMAWWYKGEEESWVGRSENILGLGLRIHCKIQLVLIKLSIIVRNDLY